MVVLGMWALKDSLSGDSFAKVLQGDVVPLATAVGQIGALAMIASVLACYSWDPMELDCSGKQEGLVDRQKKWSGRRKIGNGLPPAFPDGWRCVCLSENIKA